MMVADFQQRPAIFESNAASNYMLNGLGHNQLLHATEPLAVLNQRYSWGASKAEEKPMTVWIHVDTTRQVGDRDHLKVFADETLLKSGLRKTTRNASRLSIQFRATAHKIALWEPDRRALLFPRVLGATPTPACLAPSTAIAPAVSNGGGFCFVGWKVRQREATGQNPRRRQPTRRFSADVLPRFSFSS